MKNLYILFLASLMIISCQDNSDSFEETVVDLSKNNNKDFVLNELPDSDLYFGIIVDVNNQGIMVGEGVWINDEYNFLDLGTFGYSEGNAINNQGQIVGLLANDFDDYSPGFWNSFDSEAIELPKGTFKLGYARDINENGKIVGFVREPGSKPALWENGELTVLPTGDLPQGWADGINNRGEIVGFVSSPTDGIELPALWKNGELILLPSLGQNGIAYQINNKGQIVGSVDGKPALWDKGELIILPTGEWVRGFGEDINDSGDIVGYIRSGSDFKPALWKKGELILLPTGSLGGGNATGLNESGLIVGTFNGSPLDPVYWTSKK